MTKRTDRLNGELQKEIAAVISGELKDRDPRITGLVSVTEADIAPDLKTAKVYVSVYGISPEAKKAGVCGAPRERGLCPPCARAGHAHAHRTCHHLFGGWQHGVRLAHGRTLCIPS